MGKNVSGYMYTHTDKGIDFLHALKYFFFLIIGVIQFMECDKS